MSTFNPGDVVRLKSGGPKMTVSSYDETRKAHWCEWFFNGEPKPHGHSFKPEMLEKVPASTE